MKPQEDLTYAITMLDAKIAQRTFEVENNIKALGADENALYYYDSEAQSQLRARRPWAQDPNWFQNVHISAVALIKMVMHARSGGNIEVMGMMQGKIIRNGFVIMDVYPLPVEGTETRVNASEEGYQFMVAYKYEGERVGRKENIVGWYHSHPGYGCWLSGIDVSTQSSHQQHEDPFLAIVVDPIRTMSAGKVDIGAFRTFPHDYKPSRDTASEYQTIPMDKIEDFGVHCRQYYQLNISYFKSTLDTALLELLWNKYWARAISSSPLIQNGEYFVNQLKDLGAKIEAENRTLDSGMRVRQTSNNAARKKGTKSTPKLDEIAKDACNCSNEHLQSIMALFVRSATFGGTSCNPMRPQDPSGLTPDQGSQSNEVSSTPVPGVDDVKMAED